MSKNGKHWVGLVGVGLVGFMGSLGCDVIHWTECKSNPQHKGQSGCVCPCNNNTGAAVCHDPNNVCCYNPGGACQMTSTTTPAGTAGAAAAMPPSNRDGIRATMERCFEEKDTCTNAYPLLPCTKFFERVIYKNFADANRAASDANSTPRMTITPVALPSYPFTFPPKDVPWPALAVGAHSDEIPVEIRSTGSAGMEVAGLDPGAQQCIQSENFVVQLIGVPEFSLNPNGVFDGPLVEGSFDQPFGACQAGSSC